MRVLIITGGSIDKDFALSFIKEWKPDYKIGVDRGLDFCRKEGISLNCILGDFDSVSKESLRFFKEAGVESFTYPSKKDETDTQLAIEKGIRMVEESGKEGEIALLGATGSRLDHVMGNIHLLAEPAQKGISVELLDRHNKISLLPPGTYHKKGPKEKGTYISFFPFTDDVKGLTLKGFLYELKDYRMVKETVKGYGVSNRILGECSLSFTEGLLLCIESRD